MSNKHLFLTGFMGSGKSMLGRRISEQFHIPFEDVDDLIVQDQKKAIKDIFAEKGETYFRLLETAFLERISIRTQPHIYALGGGAICSQRNLDCCKQSGVVVFLDVSVDLLVERLIKNPKRPLLLDQNGNMKPENEVRIFVEELLEKRRVWYEKADICIKIDTPMEKEEVTSFVVEHLKPHFL